MLQNISLIELDKNNPDHVGLMYIVRSHPEVDKYLRGTAPENFFEHVKYLFHLKPGKKFFLIQSNLSLCGYCQYTISDSQVEIGMALHPHFSNKGIGSQTMALLLSKLQNDEMTKGKTVILFVKKDNLRAIALYEKYDFKREKENEFEEYLFVRTCSRSSADFVPVSGGCQPLQC